MSTELKEIHDSHGEAEGLESAEPMLTGLLGEFADVTTVYEAAAKTRAAGYKVWDVHSPFPIHGIDAVIGIRPTILPWLVLGAGVCGAAGGFLLQWFCNTFDYPLLVSGKPMLSLPANVPIIFESAVLCSALTAVFGMLALNRLPLLYNPLFKSARFRRVTNDRFFIWIDVSDAKFDEQATEEFLKSAGAVSVERIED
jgi:Alternative complex III, ActD subunit